MTPRPVERRGPRHALYCDFGRRVILPDAPAWNVGGLLSCAACLALAVRRPLRMAR